METVGGQIQGDRWTVDAGQWRYSAVMLTYWQQAQSEGGFTSKLQTGVRAVKLQSEKMSHVSDDVYMHRYPATSCWLITIQQRRATSFL